eukprot:TRINITY_DN31714_c0_g1_i1.p2 TRINITY_DN31714_c0_g1~~TRINITY_DN31714_c0_g1_i1.p2  ORF type:complete len:129 (-),score=34.56 TRINITY_DN31714_c0_g1_i1:423-809(-)
MAFKANMGILSDFINAVRISKQNSVEMLNQNRIKRIQEIQENVEYEIDEYKRRKKMVSKDKDGSIKEYTLLTNVKGVEFELHILIHQEDGNIEDIEHSVPNNLETYKQEDKKQMCDISKNKLKEPIKQ